MKKKTVFTKFALITLSLACYSSMTAHAAKFEGESAADTVLQADVAKIISQSLSMWHGKNCRKIEQIESQIMSVEQTEQGDTKQITESWKVTACGVSKTYQVRFRPDAQGEVDFGVRLPPS